MLQLEIRRGSVPLTGEAESYIRERATHLDTFYPRIISCRVTVDAPLNHHQKGGPYSVRLDIDVPGKVITVNQRKAEDLHVAIRRSFEAAQRQLEDYSRVQRKNVKTHVDAYESGAIVRLFVESGYGFIAAPDGHEVYFHQNAVTGAGFGSLGVGTRVSFLEEPGNEGPQATVVQPQG